MPIPVPSENPRASIARRPWPAGGESATREAFDKGWLLHLSQRLQVTLQLEGLLEVYAGECAPVIPFDSVLFENADREVAIEHGTRRPHSCAYTLYLSEQTLGVVTYTRARPFSEADAARLELLTSQLVYPLRNALLYHDALVAASRDPLTGANNRATLESTLDREVSLAQRHGGALSLIMFDLDHFKQVNDRHGHTTGDCVLRSFAARLGQCIRSSDVLFRYGGEEFVVVLRSTDLRGAALLAERVRVAIEALRVECSGTTVLLTVSAGVATLTAGDDAQRFLQRADKALYRSKSDGRNRVTAAA
jgi:diguanylate cyclase (GGDEF)-like protein